jgi:hypothetical protein
MCAVAHAQLLAGHECKTAQQCGWTGVTNGELLRLAARDFDLFITSDQNMRYQQNLANRQIAILELSTNDLRKIQNASELLKTTISNLQPREFRRLEVP